MNKLFQLALVFVSVNIYSTTANAAELRVAVASNFKDVFREIAQSFEKKTGHTLLISPGSTGKHFAQISNGAPYDLFLAADIDRPTIIEQRGLGVKGTRRTYAAGKLALLSNIDLQSVSHGASHSASNSTPINATLEGLNQILKHSNFRHLAIANPNHAPYGKAAMEVLRASDVWPEVKPKLVQGENIAQTFQFVGSGNAQLGFVSYSQVVDMEEQESTAVLVVPEHLYLPIEQQLILLKESQAGRELLAFMRSDTVLEIVSEYGYDTPDAE